MLGPLLAVIRIGLLALWSGLLVPPQIVLLGVHKGKKAYLIPRLWHRGVCKICGIRVTVEGLPATGGQILYVSNHLSYLDIPAIGSVLAASFIAKEEVASWPVLGFLSTVQQTAFISRNAAHAKHVKNALSNMLAEEKSLILFPEGTSSPGTEVLPFKSSLFALTLEKGLPPIPIQPFTVRLEKLGENPASESNRDLYAWHGDMDFAPHCWAFLKTKGSTLRLTFHPVMTPSSEDDRKTIAKWAWKQVAGPFFVPDSTPGLDSPLESTL